MDDDHSLVTAALARAPGAFERLVARHQGLVWHLVYRMVHHVEDCRDLSQEVFLRVHQQLPQFRFESALASWIGRIAFTIAARYLQRRRLPMLDPVADGDDDGEAPIDRVGDDFDLEAACADAELMRHLASAVDALPPLQRTLVTLYHLDELGIAQIADITGLPEGTVKSYLFRARARLRERLHDLRGVAA
jgi:RNA polymerase sigma factor (sigma-70 family)